MSIDKKEFDVIIWGASGFTGRLVAEYLFQNYNKDELNEIASVLRNHPDIFILSDEIYEHINYGSEHVSFASIEGMYDRTITVNGLSLIHI